MHGGKGGQRSRERGTQISGDAIITVVLVSTIIGYSSDPILYMPECKDLLRNKLCCDGGRGDNSIAMSPVTQLWEHPLGYSKDGLYFTHTFFHCRTTLLNASLIVPFIRNSNSRKRAQNQYISTCIFLGRKRTSISML